MPHTSLIHYLLPRVRDVLFLILFSVAMAAGWRTLNTDGDLPRHLRMGRFILETRSIPQEEMFSYVYEGRRYVAHEWLAGVIYYSFYKLGGLKGVVFLTAILTSSAFLVLYTALSKEGNDRLLTAVLVLWGAFNTYQHWIARPHLFSILLLAVWLVITGQIARGKTISPWLPAAVMLVWGNLHAEFVAGFLVLLAWMAGWVWDRISGRAEAVPGVLRTLAASFALSLLATLINPFGVRTWTTILGYIGNDQLMGTIRETRPPDFTNPGFFAEFSLLLASLLILALKKGQIQSGRAFLLAGFTALALTAGRNIHLYGVVTPFVLAGPAVEAAGPALQGRVTSAVLKIEKQLKGYLWPIMTVILFLAALGSGRIGQGYILDPQFFPIHAVDWLEENPQSGRMFNDFSWGGYIIWRLWPEHKNFIDSQSDLSGEATQMYHRVEGLEPGWQGVLDRYDVRWAILPTDSKLSSELADRGWKILYHDQTATILREE